MSLVHSIDTGTSDVGTVVKTQFGIVSPKKILEQSVANIFKHISKGGELQNTLMDPRLGASKTTKNAITGLNSKYDPGSFGHCILPLPVYHPVFFPYVKNAMKCVCHNCSSLRIIKESSWTNDMLRKSPDMRMEHFIKNLLKGKVKGVCPICQVETYDFQKDTVGQVKGLIMINKKKERVSITPKQVHDILKKISDEDANLLGFNPETSRPEWMMITVMPVPPINMRPSVIDENDKTSDDDITQSFHNIIKHANLLRDKLDELDKVNATKTDRDAIKSGWDTLQWYIATLIDNETNAYPHVTNRAHRPLNTIKGRHRGKSGRPRANLQGKRTNFSSRSVITADPNLSIAEVGVPMSIAMILTYPTTVTSRNIQHLTTLVRRGSQMYPGANEIKKPGQNYPINLACINDEERKNMKLTIGTVVYRHMLDGDIVLFNRQPSLHKMSMMCHRARIFAGQKSFKLSQNITGPYNADFDGDEMNLHLPQSEQSRIEFEHLALTPTQIVSPQGNKPVVGAVQDTLLIAYRSSSEHVRGYGPNERDYLNVRDFMHIANWISKYRGYLPEMKANGWDMRQLIDMFLPPISIKKNGEMFKEKVSIDIRNGHIVNPDKGYLLPISKANGLLGKSTSSLLHISWNDIGPEAAKNLIDDFSRVMSQWTLINGFSVGVRDIEMKVDIIAEVEKLKTFYMNQAYELIEGLNAGDYENIRSRVIGQPRGLTENWYEQFEQDMDHVLRTCKSKIEAITVKNIDIDHDGIPYDNRFMSMVNSGSKGNNVNLVQIVSILGQQDIAGGRVPDYYRRRPLAFMPKDDLSPEARGMIVNSYMVGLTLSEFIFHAMAGRLGMISTSIKTADTGYLQRKLVKLLEDLKCQYDFTVRSNSGRILQYVYGGDCFDGSHVENQSISHLTYGMEDILLTYAYTDIDWVNFRNIYINVPSHTSFDEAEEKAAVSDEIKTIIDDWTYMRKKFRDNIPKTITSVVNFDRLIKTIKNRLRSTGSVPYLRLEDILYPSYVYKALKKLENDIYLPTAKSISDHCLRGFFVLLRSKLASKIMIFQEGFNKTAFDDLLTEIKIKFYRGLIAPGEAVGVIAAQSIGEPSTQITLDAFHSTGSKVSVSGGVPRLKEILSLTKMKTPSIVIHLQNIPIPSEVNAITGNLPVNEYLASLNTVLKQTEDTGSERAATKLQIQELIMKNSVLKIKSQFEFVRFSNMVSNSEIRYIEDVSDPNLDIREDIAGYNDFFGESGSLSPWFLKFDINEHIVAQHSLRLETIVDILKASNKSLIIIHTLPNAKSWYILVNVPIIVSDPVTTLNELEDTILSTRIKGVSDITRAMVRQPPKKDIKLPSGRIVQVGTKEYTKIVDSYIDSEDYVVDTYGTNLIDIMSMPHVDPYRTYSNNIMEMYEMFGIEVARRTIVREITEVFSGAGVSFDIRHIELLADNMTSRGILQKVDRIGAKKSESGPFALACFEETTTHLCKAAVFGDVDKMNGVSANIMYGQLIKIGTGAFDMYMDEAMLMSEAQEEQPDAEDGLNVISKESFAYCNTNNFQFKFNL